MAFMQDTLAPDAHPPAGASPSCEAEMPGPDRILGIGYAFRAAKTLLSAVELGLFTALADGPCDAEVLRSKIGIAERGARDFFDALVALEILERDGAGRYRNTPEAQCYLDARKSTYIGEDLDHMNKRGYPHWHSLTAALQTGTPKSHAGSRGYFQELYADDTSLEIFVKGMTGTTRLAAGPIAAQFPWHDYRTMIDVGTAEGCLPVAIAQAHPHMTGGGFDLPAVRPYFDRYVRQHGLSRSLGFHPGDFFHDRLPCADVVIFGRVLHNWDLATKMMLLSKAHDALPAGGALIIYERLIDDDRRVNVGALLASLNMLIMTAGGFDFTGAECTDWMRAVGFRCEVPKRIAGELSMIVGFK